MRKKSASTNSIKKPYGWSDVSGFRYNLDELRDNYAGREGVKSSSKEWVYQSAQEQPQVLPEENLAIEDPRPKPGFTYPTQFSETSLSNLVGFWDASDLSTFTLTDDDLVTSWTDKTSNAYVLSQSNDPEKPIYSPSVINKKPGLRFVPGADTHNLLAQSDFLTGNSYTFFFVLKLSVNQSVSWLMDARGDASFSAVFTLSNLNFIANDTSSLTASFNIRQLKLNNALVGSCVIDGNNKSLQVQLGNAKAIDYNQNYGGGTFSGVSNFILGRSVLNNTPSFSGVVSELLIYEGVKTQAEIDKMHVFLNNKWLVF